MTNFFVAIDAWLIDRVFQPISWLIEARFGWNNFRIGQVIAVLAIAYSVVELVNTGNYSWALSRGLLSIFIIFLAMTLERRMRPGVMNSLRLGWLIPRIIWAILVIVLAIVANTIPYLPISISQVIAGELSINNRVFWVAWGVCLYFFSCTKMPPEWKMPERVVTGKVATQ